MTGIIVTLELTQKGGSLTTTELQELEEEIASNYGVSIDEVQLDVEYEITGSMKINIPEEGLSEEEIIEIEETLQTQLGEELGVHPERIDVSVNPETGEVIYAIKTDDVSDAEQIQSLLETKSDEITTAINEEFENNPDLENLSGIKVEEIQVDEDIIMDIDVSIDGSESDIIWKKSIILLLKTNMKD